jgi:hypothetical protein
MACGYLDKSLRTRRFLSNTDSWKRRCVTIVTAFKFGIQNPAVYKTMAGLPALIKRIKERKGINKEMMFANVALIFESDFEEHLKK